MPVRKIRLRIDLGSIEERGKVHPLLREDFQELSTVPEDDLGPAWPLLSPFRRDYDPVPVVDFLNDCAHSIYLTICRTHRIVADVLEQGDLDRNSVRVHFLAP